MTAKQVCLLLGKHLRKTTFFNNGIHSRFISTSQIVNRRRRDDEEFIEVEPPPAPQKDPVNRTIGILKHDFKKLINPNIEPYSEFSTHVDVCIIGGGAIGSSIAFWLKHRTGSKDRFSVSVIEKDPGYTRSSTVLSVGGLRQQFSLKENIEMSMYGAEFLRKAPHLLQVDDGGPPVDMQFHPYGYLFLATEQGAEQLQQNWLLQKELGAKVELLTKYKLKEKFPWVDTTGIELACHGLENEGWFDPWALLYGLKRKGTELGVEYVKAEVVGFKFHRDQWVIAGQDINEPHYGIEGVVVKDSKGELKTIKAAFYIVAAGHDSGKVAEMARIGRYEGLLSVPLPVEARKRYVYCFHAPDGPGLDCPLVIDPSGAYFRREGLGGIFIVKC